MHISDTMYQKAKFIYTMCISLFMEITKIILFAVYAAVAAYILYFMFFKRNPYQREYERLYNEILNSDKHKVKGQWSDRER